MRKFHVSLGLILLAMYLFVIFHTSRYFPKLAAPSQINVGQFNSARSDRGLAIAYGLPLAGIICFLFPTRLKFWLSPRTPPEYDYLLTEGVWYAIGYFLVLLGIGVLMLFR